MGPRQITGISGLERGGESLGFRGHAKKVMALGRIPGSGSIF